MSSDRASRRRSLTCLESVVLISGEKQNALETRVARADAAQKSGRDERTNDWPRARAIHCCTLQIIAEQPSGESEVVTQELHELPMRTGALFVTFSQMRFVKPPSSEPSA